MVEQNAAAAQQGDKSAKPVDKTPDTGVTKERSEDISRECNTHDKQKDAEQAEKAKNNNGGDLQTEGGPKGKAGDLQAGNGAEELGSQSSPEAKAKAERTEALKKAFKTETGEKDMNSDGIADASQKESAVIQDGEGKAKALDCAAKTGTPLDNVHNKAAADANGDGKADGAEHTKADKAEGEAGKGDKKLAEVKEDHAQDKDVKGNEKAKEDEQIGQKKEGDKQADGEQGGKKVVVDEAKGETKVVKSGSEEDKTAKVHDEAAKKIESKGVDEKAPALKAEKANVGGNANVDEPDGGGPKKTGNEAGSAALDVGAGKYRSADATAGGTDAPAGKGGDRVYDGSKEDFSTPEGAKKAIENFSKTFEQTAGKERAEAMKQHLLNAYDRLQNPEYKGSPEKAGKQMQGMLDAMNRVQQSDGMVDGKQVRNTEGNNRIVEGIARRADNPQEFANQGKHSTCALESKGIGMFETDPARAAEIISDVATKGEFKNSYNETVKVPADSLKLDWEARGNYTDNGGRAVSGDEIYGKGGKRDAAGQMLDLAAGNALAKEMGKADGNSYEYRQNADNAGGRDTGERFVQKMPDGTEKVITNSPHADPLNTARMHKAMDGQVNMFIHKDLAADMAKDNPNFLKEYTALGGKVGSSSADLSQQMKDAQKETGRSGSVFLYAGRLGENGKSSGHDLHSMAVRYNESTGKFDGLQTWGGAGDRETAGMSADKLFGTTKVPTKQEADEGNRNPNQLIDNPSRRLADPGGRDEVNGDKYKQKTEAEKQKEELDKQKEKEQQKEKGEGEGKDPNKKADNGKTRDRWAQKQAELNDALAKVNIYPDSDVRSIVANSAVARLTAETSALRAAV